MSKAKEVIKATKKVLKKEDESAMTLLLKKAGNFDVPQELLLKYVSIIKQMEQNRGTSSTYARLDREREKIHKELCKHVGVGKNDKKFSLWLSVVCDQMTNNA